MATIRLPAAPGLSDGPDLLLRCPQPVDVDGIAAQGEDPDFQRWTEVPVPYRKAYALQYLEDLARHWQDGTVASFAIVFRGRYARLVDLRLDGDAGDVGYGLLPWARGAGVMSRALRLVLAWGFDELGLQVVHWRAVAGNWDSRRVANRCGFRVEGSVRGLIALRGERYDGWIASVRRDDPLTGTPDVPLPPAPELSDGPGLLVRCPRADDVDGIVAQSQDPESQAWTRVPVPYRETDARAYLAWAAQGWRDGAAATFAIVHGGRYAGSIGLRPDGAGGAEVYYGLGPWARGKGVMTRALRLVLAWGFDELGLGVVHWRAAVGNSDSHRVATRCGFRVEGSVRGLAEQRGVRRDCWIGSLRREELLTG